MKVYLCVLVWSKVGPVNVSNSQGMLSSHGYRCHSTHSRRGGFVLRYQHHDVAAKVVTSHKKSYAIIAAGVACGVMLCYASYSPTRFDTHSFSYSLEMVC